MSTARVTVCIPAYNHPDFLRETLVSLCDQGLNRDEYVVAVSDDASPTSLQQVISVFQDKLQIFYQRSQTNVGHIANFETAVRLADTPYVSILPHDDIIAPGQLGRLLPLLEQDSRIVLGASLVVFQKYSGAMDAYLHGIFLRGSAGKSFVEPYLWDQNEWMASALVRTPLSMVGAIFHTESFRKCHQWKSFPMWHDRVWCAEMGLYGRVISLPWVGGYYRISDSQVSAQLMNGNSREFREVSQLVLRLCESANIPVREFWIGHVCQAGPRERIAYLNMLNSALPFDVFKSIKNECERRLQSRLHLGGRLARMGVPWQVAEFLRRIDRSVNRRFGRI